MVKTLQMFHEKTITECSQQMKTNFEQMQENLQAFRTHLEEQVRIYSTFANPFKFELF